MNKELYRNFSDGIYAAAKTYEESTGKRVLLDVMIELTRLCSIKCTHCYIGDARWTKDPEEMSTEQTKQLLDHLAASGTLWVCFTGGEALMRRDFKEIWLYAKKKGFILSLFTNATLITEELADFFLEYPAFNIEVSIYGATQTTYEKVSLVKGSHKRFMHGIQNLLDRPQLKWKLKTVVIQENVHELYAMEELAQEWGVEFKFDPVINPSVGYGKSGGKAPCASRLDEGTVNRVDLGKAARKDEALSLMKSCSKEDDDRLRPEALFGCGAGKNSSYFTAKGEMQMCVLTANFGGQTISQNQFSQTKFSKVWDSFGEARKIKLRPDSPCRGCDLALICSNCPGFAFLENGDAHSSVEYLCRVTHQKAEMLKMPHACNEKHFVHHPKLKGSEDEKHRITPEARSRTPELYP